MKTHYLFVMALAFVMGACCNKSGDKTCTGEEKESCCAGAEKDNFVKIITAKKHIKPEKVDDYIQATKELIEKSRAEEGNISYTLYQHPEDKTVFIFFEEWKNQAAIDYHFSTEHFKEFGTRGDEFDAAPGELTIYTVVPEK
ncbi:MAG: antibiotic biosynthesis monooxygenase [Candidatus Azobacteroides sp.]|nr:antibiotic biosynthesis monooxygenase [Candidatus Azobacteroides sp.]